MDIIEIVETAGTAIRTNKVRSFLTTLGIVIGVGSVILLVSIGQGLQALVTKQFDSLGANLIFVLPGKIDVKSGPGRPVALTPKFTFLDAKNLKRLGGAIGDVTSIAFRNSSVQFKTKVVDAQVNGVEGNFSKLRNVEAARGTFITDSMVERSARVVVIGPKLEDDLFGEKDSLGLEVEISGRSYRVVGVTRELGGGFGAGNDQDRFAYLPITTAVKAFGTKNPAALYVQAVSFGQIDEAERQTKSYFQKRNLTEDDFTIIKPEEIVSSINSLLGGVTAALGGIAAISLLVGGIGIANIMLVSVTERTREIGLRKAVGATRKDILVQFLVEAVMLSLLGGVLGVIGGWGFSWALRRFIETKVTAGSVLLAFGVSTLVGVVAGIAPAINASRKPPIEALRFE